MRINGKTVIVTSVARGIGRGIAEAFTHDGELTIAVGLGYLSADDAIGKVSDTHRAHLATLAVENRQ